VCMQDRASKEIRTSPLTLAWHDSGQLCSHAQLCSRAQLCSWERAADRCTAQRASGGRARAPPGARPGTRGRPRSRPRSRGTPAAPGWPARTGRRTAPRRPRRPRPRSRCPAPRSPARARAAAALGAGRRAPARFEGPARLARRQCGARGVQEAERVRRYDIGSAAACSGGADRRRHLQRWARSAASAARFRRAAALAGRCMRASADVDVLAVKSSTLCVLLAGTCCREGEQPPQAGGMRRIPTDARRGRDGRPPEHTRSALRGAARGARASENFLAAALYFLASSAASAPAHLSLAAVTLSRTASGVCSACEQPTGLWSNTWDGRLDICKQDFAASTRPA